MSGCLFDVIMALILGFFLGMLLVWHFVAKPMGKLLSFEEDERLNP